jgi:hypothetical protein
MPGPRTQEEPAQSVSSVQIIALVIGALAVTIGLVVIGVLAYRQLERSYLLRLVSRQEAVGAAGRSLEGALDRLASADDDVLQSFADDPESVERRVISETAERAHALSDELDRMPMPRKLAPAAAALADAAYVVGEEAGRVGDDTVGDDALTELGSVDLGRVSTAFSEARPILGQACEECRLEDQSVYGGGLYL